MNDVFFFRCAKGWRAALMGLAWLLCLGPIACRSHLQERIAVIPQTEGNMIWEAVHVGAETAAHRQGAFIYWNAPTREDDVEAQIALIDRVVRSGYQGLVLAPDQALALISPVRRALARGIPTVIIGSPLAIPAGGHLSYILNDDESGGRIAAQRVEQLLHGKGVVAVLGVDPDLTGIMIRARAFEQALAQDAPGIRIVERRMGSFNVPREQQVAQETLASNPDLDVIVALMSTALDGTLSALDAERYRHPVRVIGFDVADWPSFDHNPCLDSIIQEDTRSMGEEAVQLILAQIHGHSASESVKLQPVVITRANVNSAQVRRMWSQDWTLGHWPWSPIQ